MSIFKAIGIQEVIGVRPHGPVTKVFNVPLDEKVFHDTQVPVEGDTSWSRGLVLDDLITIIDNQAWHKLVDGKPALNLAPCHFGGSVKRLGPGLYEVIIHID